MVQSKGNIEFPAIHVDDLKVNLMTFTQRGANRHRGKKETVSILQEHIHWTGMVKDVK